MRRVILESPFGGNPPLYIAYARACIKDSIHRGEAPLASHLLYTQPGILDDNVAEERQLGMQAGWEWYRCAEAAVVYRDFGISEGMRHGINLASQLGMPIDYRRLPMRDGKGDLTIWLSQAYPGVASAFPGYSTEAPYLSATLGNDGK